MGQEISKNFYQFARHYNQFVKNQELSPTEEQTLAFDLSIATGTVAEMVAKLGPKVEQDAHGKYYVNFAKILKAEEGSIDSLRLTADAVELDTHLNIDHFLQ
ncbi:MAG: hypothetical protein ACAI44_02700 [Candidatus Sericytochromatia bacterium]